MLHLGAMSLHFNVTISVSREIIESLEFKKPEHIKREGFEGLR